MATKKLLFLGIIIMLLIGVWILAFWPKQQQADARGPAYAGAATCVRCHKDVYQSFLGTAHNQSSEQASAHNIHGSFANGHNVFSFANNQKVIMEKRDSGFYQVGYINGKAVETRRFDVTFGSVKAQTYAYWQGEQLFELPISYFNGIHSWTSSPGYTAKRFIFDRPIIARCMECHSSYIYENKQLTLIKNTTTYAKNTLIYGIDCERCHGPAARHVEFHEANPDEKKAHFMVAFKSLTRAQKLDACAVCHSGGTDRFASSPFGFKPGDTLANFKIQDFAPQKVDATQLDVHGNQSGLLAASRCFLMSNMDCTNCHNTHVNDRGNLKMYSQKCISCHNTQNHNLCKLTAQLGNAITSNCIDCHMPAKTSNLIGVHTGDEADVLPYMVRTHRIAIYPEETKRIVSFIEKQTIHKN